MAGSGLQADIPSLKAGGKDLTSVGERYQSAVGKLKNALTGLEGQDTPPWGDDDIGEKFGVVYEGLRDGMYESMGHLAAKLQEIGGALNAMADNHQADEDFNESLMKQHVANAEANSQQIIALKSPNV
ncbi:MULTISPECIES: WXG100 family type VII secretion target [unclassified Streptomyces]|uniref:WXG100 family type VII secretion target n=1 Tax=unclassified Streptomyces TaxID=2593676 RepID=UPI00380B972F